MNNRKYIGMDVHREPGALLTLLVPTEPASGDFWEICEDRYQVRLRGLARYCRFPQFSSTAANRGGASPFARFRLQELQTLCESCTFG